LATEKESDSGLRNRTRHQSASSDTAATRGLNNAVDDHPLFREVHWYDWFNFERILNAAEGANIKCSVVLKGNTTDEIGYWILRRSKRI